MRGSIIDGGAFAGDSPVATDWYGGTLATTGTVGITGRTWAGNQTIYDGAVISLFLPSSGTNAFPATFSASTAPSIDGFDLRGGDQAGFPGNINAIGGGPTGLPGGLITQGGAIFANGYARNLQITNNVVQNNGGAYGTIRIGTPDLPAPDTNNHNEGVRIANNRIIANAGTNLAGGIGLFNGADSYEVAKQRCLRQFLVRVRRRDQRAWLQPQRPDPRQPDLFQPVVRRGRRHHDRRRAAGQHHHAVAGIRTGRQSTTT